MFWHLHMCVCACACRCALAGHPIGNWIACRHVNVNACHLFQQTHTHIHTYVSMPVRVSACAHKFPLFRQKPQQCVSNVQQQHGELGCCSVKFIAKYKSMGINIYIYVHICLHMYFGLVKCRAALLSHRIHPPPLTHPPYMCHLPPQLTTRKRKSFARSCIIAVARDEQFWLCQ